MISISEKQKNRKQKCAGGCAGLGCPGWWEAVPEEERAVLWSVVRGLRAARRSSVPAVARGGGEVGAGDWLFCEGAAAELVPCATATEPGRYFMPVSLA
jgi:hypothetical protein